MTSNHELARGLAAALFVAATAACGGERTTSPLSSTLPVELRRNGWADKKGTGDTTTTTFAVRPNKNAKLTIDGGHMVYIPAGAICDLASAGYGPTVWETPCTPEKQRVTVTARSWVDSIGHPHVEFSPELRFTPDDSKLVWLVMYDPAAAQDTSSRIMFCPSLDGACVDESLADRDLDTRFDDRKELLYRRVKHFSSYRVLAREGSSVAQ